MSNDKEHLLAGRYLIREKLSSDGATGYVYLAEDMTKDDGNNLCAVKELDPHTSNSEDHRIFCERFKDEERYLRILNGFNGQIPKYIDTIPSEDGKEIRYIVQEYIEGKTLSYKLKEERTLSESKVKQILISLLPIIFHIHSKDFIHRDINPANIILRSQSDLPVLIDFGAVKDVARTIVASSKQTNHQTIIIGKDGYMAPEHLDGQPEVRSDLYSLGVTAIELLSGLNPKNIRRDLTTKKLLWPDHLITRDFAAVLDKATQESVWLRYSDAQAMLKALESVAVPESDNEIKQRLGDPLSLERQPKTPSENYRKCYAHDCDFNVTLENEYCPNCGTYNVYQLSKKEFHLMHFGAEAHLAWIAPDYSKWWVIRLGKYILKDENTHYTSGGLGWLGAIIGVVAGWLKGEGYFGTIGSMLLGGLGGLFYGFLLFGIIWLLGKVALIKYTPRLLDLEGEKADIDLKVDKATRKNQYSGSYLIYIEKEISGQQETIATKEKNLKERLLSIQRDIKEGIGTSQLQKNEEKFQLALAESKQQYKKYQVKLLEIKLLRLHNQLQANTNRKTMNEETSYKLEKELGDLNKRVNQMYDALKEANTVNSEGGKRWIVRILRAREILAEAVTLLITHRDELYLLNRVNVTIQPPEELGLQLDLLNAYITYDDFYQEYQALRSEQL